MVVCCYDCGDAALLKDSGAIFCKFDMFGHYFNHTDEHLAPEGVT